MNVITSRVNVLCRRKGFLSAILDHTVFQSSVLPCTSQVRFKSKRSKEKKVLKADESFVRFTKRKEEDQINHQIYSTPATDDVWIRKYYPTTTCTFLEALHRHRELASPEMTANADGSVVLMADLNLKSEKKQKFIPPPEGLLLMPHNFDNFFPGRVVAITKNEAEQKKADEAGAIYSGGIDLIRKIEKGDIKPEDFDRVVLSYNAIEEAAVLKKYLKDLYPVAKNGNLGDDVPGMVALFTYGKEYKAMKVSEGVGKLSLAIGRLSMTDDQLLENIKSILATVADNTSSSRTAQFYSKLSILCPPSTEVFIVDDPSIMPVMDAKIKKKPKKGEKGKAAKEAKEVKEEVEEEVKEEAAEPSVVAAA